MNKSIIRIVVLLTTLISTCYAETVPYIAFLVKPSAFGCPSKETKNVSVVSEIRITNKFKNPHISYYDTKGNLVTGVDAIVYGYDLAGRVVTNPDGTPYDCSSCIIVDTLTSGNFWTVDQIAHSWNGQQFAQFSQMIPGNGYCLNVNFRAFTYGPKSVGSIISSTTVSLAKLPFVRINNIGTYPSYKGLNFIGMRFFVAQQPLDALAKAMPLMNDNLAQNVNLAFFSIYKDIGKNYQPNFLLPSLQKTDLQPFYVGITLNNPATASYKDQFAQGFNHNDFVVINTLNSTWYTIEDIAYMLQKGYAFSSFALSIMPQYYFISINTSTSIA